MTDLSLLDGMAQAALVQSGTASPAELVEAAIDRIEKLNGELNAVIHPLYDRARAQVREGLADGPFKGVPIVVKDLDGTLAGVPYHGGNKALKDANHMPTTTSTLFAKLERAGFVIVGKANTPEFGLLPTTEPEAYGAAHNPWDVARSPGGSSGGSAAAVSSGMVPLAHAGDGGGSIRIPSSMCNLFGLKPTRGRISLGPDEHESWAGLVMRHVVTHSVRDSAAVLDVLQGYEVGDWYTAPPPERPYAEEVGAPAGKLRIGLLTSAPLGIVAVDDECAAAVRETAKVLESLGHTVVEAAPAALDDGALLETFTVVMVSAVHADMIELERLIGRPVTADDVEAATWANYQAGAAIDAGTYIDALVKMQAWARRTIAWWFDDGFDVLLTPTLAEPPPLLGELIHPDTGAGRLLPFVLFTAPFNVTGQPAMSVPLAMSSSGLPIGVQCVGAPYREDVLIRLAAQLEEARPWADRRPSVHA